jgi:hypothetical protein
MTYGTLIARRNQALSREKRVSAVLAAHFVRETVETISRKGYDIFDVHGELDL